MSTNNKRPTLLLLDGHAIIHRAYHALPPLTAPDGRQVNAVYGFASTLLNVLEQFQPDYIIATFDHSGATFRHDMYDQYKAHRTETPEDLVPQFAIVQEFVSQCGIAVESIAGVEADDVIGTLAGLAAAEDVNTIVVTGDKDTFQLVDDHVQVFTMSRGIQDMRLYDRAGVISKMGIAPEQVIDYKGICGDSSDNIPGVKGIGDKGAVMLLQHFENLDGVYAHIDDDRIKPAMRKKLEEQKEQAYLSRDLGTIKTDVANVVFDTTKAAAANFDPGAARAASLTYGFKSIIKRLPETTTETPAEKTELTVVRTNATKTLKSYAGAHVACVVDVDANGLHGIALAQGTREDYITCTGQTEAAVRAFLDDPKSQIIVYDLKSMLHACDMHDISLEGVVGDVLIDAYVLQTGNKLTFEQMVYDALGRVRTAKGDTPQMHLALRDDEEEQRASIVAARDIYDVHMQYMSQFAQVVATQRKGVNIETLRTQMEFPLIRILFAMEQSGIAIDAEVFARIAEETDSVLEQLTQEIYDLAGSSTFNINSTQQLRAVLFETLALPTDGIKQTKTGYSTAASELEKLQDVHPIIGKIAQYRELFKLKSTYIDALPKLVASDGRIHTQFNQVVTSTGRLSSSDPNVQNIPVRTATGRALREGFAAEKGNVLVSADYSQIDLRCVAHVAADKEMIRAFNDGADIHTFTAAAVLGKDAKDISKSERSSAKELNFGLIYGMGVRSFAKSAEISIDEAKKFVDAYFAQFSGVERYMEETKKQAHDVGYVETLLGRRKYTPELQSANQMMRAAGERAAINMPIQGLTADIMKLAMIAVAAHLENSYVDGSVQMLLQVHDEIILEAPTTLGAQVAAEVAEIMSRVYKLDVPLVVDTAIGKHWGEL